MKSHLYRCVVTAVLIGMVTACDGDPAPAAAEQAEESPPATTSPTAGTPATDEAEMAAAGQPATQAPARELPDAAAVLEQMRHDIWWNAPVVIDALELTEDQRSTMDGFLTGLVETNMAIRQESPELMQQYRAALIDQRWDDAEQLAAEMAQMAGNSMAGNFELQVGVLRVLDAEQFKTAVEEYPGLIERRQWVRGRRVLGAEQLGQASRGRNPQDREAMREQRRTRRGQRPEDGG